MPLKDMLAAVTAINLVAYLLVALVMGALAIARYFRRRQ